MKICNGVLVISLFSLFIAGCALLTPVNTETTRYTLDQMPTQVPKARKHPIDLVVLLPETSAVYNTSKMAYSLQAHQISYYSKNQWGGLPSQMLQPLIVGTVQSTHYFKAVITPPVESSDNTYMLRTQLLELLQDYTVKPAMLRMAVRVTLINTTDNRVIATANFSRAIPMKQQTPYAGVLAANQATAYILHCMSEFIVHTLRTSHKLGLKE